MGWIEDLAHEKGYKSLRAVAHAMAGSALRPHGDTRSADTIANKLRDADKGKDVAWWTMGAGQPLVPSLAELLGEEETELIERLQNRPSDAAGEGAALWPFKMFPALRPIDLGSEDPFPGIPRDLVRAGGPKGERTWWVAPAGAGKTLVGRWLERRYDWIYLQAERWVDIDLPKQGRAFVELTSNAELSAEALESIPQSVKVCIAAPTYPPRRQTDEARMAPDAGDRFLLSRAQHQREPVPSPSGFAVLTSQPPQAWVRPLIKWVAARVKPGGGFDAEGVEEMFDDENLPALFETPGDLLAFLGMVDHVGIDSLKGDQHQPHGPLRWIRVWLTAASERPDRRSPIGVADLLAKRGSELLLEMAMEQLRRGLGPSLSEPEWIALVPREQAPDIDRDRLLAVVDEGAPDALSQVRAMLAPDGVSVVSGLKAVGALAEAGASRLILRPAWVANTIASAAIDRLYNNAPDGLGALLLSSNTSESALRRLINDVCAGRTNLVEPCLVARRSSSPEQMAALNGTFRAIGLALAAGVAVPTRLARAAWERQMAHVSLRSTHLPPIPILMVARQSHGRGVTSNSAWFLAAFAIARALVDAGVDLGRSSLNPWRGLPEGKEDQSRCVEALANTARVFQDGTEVAAGVPLQRAIYRLGGDLFDRVGAIRTHPKLLEIQGPDLLVALAEGKVELQQEGRQQLLDVRFGLEILEDACRRRQVSLDDVLAWCWSTWGAEPGQWPPIIWLRRTGQGMTPEGAKRLWWSAPARTLSERLLLDLKHYPEVWPMLTEQVWARWLEVWAACEGRSQESIEAFRHIPQAMAIQAVRDGRVDPWCHEIRRLLWARMPDALIALVDELATVAPTPHPVHANHGGPIMDLVWSVPNEYCEDIVERARVWCSAPSSYPGVTAWLRPWLLQVVEQRSPGWRAAYDLVTAVTEVPTELVPVATVATPAGPRRQGARKRKRPSK